MLSSPLWASCDHLRSLFQSCFRPGVFIAHVCDMRVCHTTFPGSSLLHKETKPGFLASHFTGKSLQCSGSRQFCSWPFSSPQVPTCCVQLLPTIRAASLVPLTGRVLELPNGKGNAIPLSLAGLRARVGVLLSIGGRTEVAVGIIHRWQVQKRQTGPP